jgi:hypothetical protein
MKLKRTAPTFLYAFLTAVLFAFTGCFWLEECPTDHCGIGGDEEGKEPTEISTGSGNNPVVFDPAHYTDAPPDGELGRALLLLESSKHPFHAVRAKPLPEFEELDGLQGWNAYSADDYDIRIYVMLFNNQAEGLAAIEVLQKAADETAAYRNSGVNGALLYFVETDAESTKDDEEYWVIADYVSALAGEE